MKSNMMALSDGRDPEYTLPSLHPRTMLACCPKGNIKPPLPEDSKATEKQLWISVIPPQNNHAGDLSWFLSGSSACSFVIAGKSGWGFYEMSDVLLWVGTSASSHPWVQLL